MAKWRALLLAGSPRGATPMEVGRAVCTGHWGVWMEPSWARPGQEPAVREGGGVRGATRGRWSEGLGCRPQAAWGGTLLRVAPAVARTPTHAVSRRTMRFHTRSGEKNDLGTPGQLQQSAPVRQRKRFLMFRLIIDQLSSRPPAASSGQHRLPTAGAGDPWGPWGGRDTPLVTLCLRMWEGSPGTQ